MQEPTGCSTDPAALQEVTATAARLLTDLPRRRAALAYLSKRGIDPDGLPEAWPVGYAPPGWTRLTDRLRREGFPDQALLDAGLARRCSRGTLIDVFRDRVIFPVHDRDGRVAGLIGRDLSGDPRAPKYLNTRETPLFAKGSLLYGLHEGTSVAAASVQPVLVEGPLDVLALTTRDGGRRLLPVAPSGTAVTPTQARLIAEHAGSGGSVVVAMDPDAPGQAAALAAGEQLRRAGAQVRLAALPPGCDPADYLAAGRDIGVFHAAAAIPLVVGQLRAIIAAAGDSMQWVEGRLDAARAMADTLTAYPAEDAVRYCGWIAGALDLFPSSVAYALGDAFARAHALPPSGTKAGDLLRAAAARREDTVLAAVEPPGPSLLVAR